MKKAISLIILGTLSLTAADLNQKNQIETKSHKTRIEILKEAEQCISNVKSPQEFKACEKKAKEASKAFKNASFEDKKEFVIYWIDKRIETLNKLKNCFESTQNMKEMRECRIKYVK